jgi:ribosomal protein S18 acetylase RimI-like enzyme
LVDTTLLHALDLGVIDFLVTEDKGLHDRARKFSDDLASRTLFISDANQLLKTTYEPVQVPIRYVEEVSAHTIPIKNNFFDSLREDYSGFDEWWSNKCVRKRRRCWIVNDNDQELAGLVVRKDESANDTDATFKEPKILKVCTFKVSPMNRGIKLGELLLKQVLWYGQSNGYDSVYLTSYPKQTVLLNLLEYYGFQRTAESEQGEYTYERRFHQSKPHNNIQSPFNFHKTNYPRFISQGVRGFCIPIQGRYHDTLFPDIQDNYQQDIFSKTDKPNKPGNTIRKVYLCRAKSNLSEPGALLFFYKSQSLAHTSQAITAVGILENFCLAKSTKELTRLAGGRSVYSENQLIEFKATEKEPVKVINFLLACYVEPSFSLEQMNNIGMSLPQSISEIKQSTLSKLLKATKLDD